MIWLFWVLAMAMTVAAAALVLWPLWRRNAPGTSRREENVAIYRERIAELRADAESGRLQTEEAQALEDELGRRLLAEADDGADEPEGRIAGASKGLSAVLLVALPAAALSLYLAGGDWRLVGDGPPPLPHLVDRLERRVEAEPENARAWMLLGRAREGLEDYAGAAEAYARLNELSSDQPRADLLVMEAQARSMAQDGGLQGRPAELFDQALAHEPENGRALWYAGLAAARADQPGRARRLWQRLSEQELPDDFRQVLEEQLAALPQ